MSGRRALGLALVALLCVGTAARAERPAAPASGVLGPPAGSAAGPKEGRNAEQLRKEVLERMRALRAWRIVDELKLDEATSARLFPILAKFDEREMALAAEKRDIVREIRVQLDSPKPDDARLGKSIDRLLANRVKRHALQDERFKELRKALTATQQAKLAILLPRLERDFARWVHDVAGRHEDDTPAAWGARRLPRARMCSRRRRRGRS